MSLVFQVVELLDCRGLFSCWVDNDPHRDHANLHLAINISGPEHLRQYCIVHAHTMHIPSQKFTKLTEYPYVFFFVLLLLFLSLKDSGACHRWIFWQYKNIKTKYYKVIYSGLQDCFYVSLSVKYLKEKEKY